MQICVGCVFLPSLGWSAVRLECHLFFESEALWGTGNPMNFLVEAQPCVRHVEGASKRDTREIPFWGPESMASCPSLNSSVVYYQTLQGVRSDVEESVTQLVT